MLVTVVERAVALTGMYLLVLSGWGVMAALRGGMGPQYRAALVVGALLAAGVALLHLALQLLMPSARGAVHLLYCGLVALALPAAAPAIGGAGRRAALLYALTCLLLVMLLPRLGATDGYYQ